MSKYNHSDASSFSLSALISQGKAQNTILNYTKQLQRLHKSLLETTLEERRCEVHPFEDYRWLSNHRAVRRALDNIKPESIIRPTVAAIRGTLRPLPNLFSLYKEEQEEFCLNRPQNAVPSQQLSEKERERWVSLKELKQHIKTYEPALNEMHKRRRACQPQRGFPGEPFYLSINDKKVITRHLALSLYCNQPPVRLDMGRLIIYERTVPEVGKREANYLLCEDPSERPYPKYVAHWSEFKTAKHHEGVVVSAFKPKVCKHLFESLKLWPRKYTLSLLEDNSRPLGKTRLSAFLSEAGPRPGLGVGMLRKIYISDFTKNEMPESKRKELADAMHHTVNTQRSFYERKGA